MTYKPQYSKIASDTNNVYKKYVFEKAEKFVQICLKVRLRSNFKSIIKLVWHGWIDWIQEIGPCHSKIWQFAKFSGIIIVYNSLDLSIQPYNYPTSSFSKKFSCIIITCTTFSNIVLSRH